LPSGLQQQPAKNTEEKMSQLRYSKTHEWACLEGKNARVGISDYAQSQLGDVVFIELPDVGAVFTQSAQCATVESTKAASEIYAPLSGKVTAVNSELADNPQWINESPEEKGWIFILELSKPEQIPALMDEAAYKAFIKEESH
jgi:glycine cleavage system H protein